MQPLTSSLSDPFISIPPQTIKWCKKSMEGEREETITWSIFWWCPWVGKIPWRREWLPTPIFLPGEFHGQRSLADYSPQSLKELNTTEWLSLSLLSFLSFWPMFLAGRLIVSKTSAFQPPKYIQGLKSSIERAKYIGTACFVSWNVFPE